MLDRIVETVQGIVVISRTAEVIDRVNQEVQTILAGNILCEMQLEITCRGQRLQPTMTLQQVRDTIWRPVPAEAAAVLPAPGSPSTNQLMTLHYGREC